MRAATVAAVLLVALAGVASTVEDTPPRHDAAPTATGAAPVDATRDPAESAAVAAAATRFVFGFTSISDAEDPRIVEWAEDPCGVTAFAAVDRMPVDDPSLLPDYVVEFGADGHELRRWGKPYSAEIVAVVGERLHFRARHDGFVRTFWTLADGSVGLLDDTLANPAAAPAPGFAENAEAIDCPALPVFAGSDYLQCYEIAGDDGIARRFAWEGACS